MSLPPNTRQRRRSQHSSTDSSLRWPLILKQQPAGYNTGAIVGTAKTARDYRFNPDQWNRYQITADGDHLVVELNGETTLDVHDARFSDGHLRLQYQQFPIAFRNIKIRSLP